MSGVGPNEFRGDAGFSLLETLIAFAILSLITIVTLQAFAGNAKSLSRVAEKEQQSQRLQSALAEVVAGSVSGPINPDFKIEYLPTENMRAAWTTMLPTRITLSLMKDGKATAQIETVIFVDKPQ